MISLGYVWQNHVAMCFSTGSSRRSLDFLSEIPCESSTTEKSLWNHMKHPYEHHGFSTWKSLKSQVKILEIQKMMGSEVVHEVSSPIPRRDSSTAAWPLGAWAWAVGFWRTCHGNFGKNVGKKWDEQDEHWFSPGFFFDSRWNQSISKLQTGIFHQWNIIELNSPEWGIHQKKNAVINPLGFF